MTRRILAALAATLATLALAGGAAAADSGASAARLTPTGEETFPQRSYLLTLPAGSSTEPSEIEVLENGSPVDSLRVSVPGADGNVASVLAIDASDSMKGEPIRGAMQAARAFVATSAPNVRIGVLLFNANTTVVTAPTTDRATLEKALKGIPTLATGTHIYDAVDASRRLLARADARFGSIVLLSDGTDVGSTVTRAAAVRGAQRARVRVFSVGLRSRQFDETSLGRISAATRGSFVVADKASGLRRLFTDLSSVISNEFLVSYRSLAEPAKDVFVTARTADGQTAVASYVSPGIAGDRGSTRSFWDKLVQSNLTAAILSLIVVALAFSTAFFLTKSRDRRLQDRILMFTGEGLERRAAERRADVNTELHDQKESRLGEIHPIERFLADMELAGVRTPAQVLVLYVVAASLGGGILLAILFGTPWLVLVGLVGPLAARRFAALKLQRTRRAFAEQLPETLDVLSSALRAGHSLMGAMTVAVDAAAEPSRSEYGRALADEQLGVPLDDALRVVAHRMQNRNVIQLALVARLQREAGTNAAEVLDHVSNNVRAEMDLQRLVRSLTAQGRMARWIVSALPVVLFVLLYFLNKEYLEPLWQEALGKAALVVAGLLIVSGSLIIKKIVDIKA